MSSVNKRRRKKNRKISGSGKVLITVAAAILACAAVFFTFRIIKNATIDTSHSGLSESQIPEMNIYRRDHFTEKDGFLYYDDSNYTSKQGIDVSTYQKDIDWKKVKKSGISFAMIRVGYRANDTGKIYKDRRFEENVKGATEAGIDVGVYFFSEARTRKEAIREAKFVIKNLKGKKINYPVAFDMEDTHEKDRHESLTKEQRTIIADTFCQVIKNNGYEPMIYSYPGWIYKKVDYTRLTRYDMWLAHYTEKTNYPFHFLIWQYSDSGKVPGISTKVDLDIMFIRK